MKMTASADDEIVAAIQVPTLAAGSGSALAGSPGFLKLTALQSYNLV